ncbi:MAG: hypothetical protein KAT69_10105, partial [Candidatus Aminicenantes bacterium]|nr:hypothetical protein [Candidatus Aminicenantes bacterium]
LTKIQDSKHPYFRDKETVRQTDSSARVFSPARKIHLFLGSLSSSRNHARSPPDGFLTRLPDCFFVMGIKMLLNTGRVKLTRPEEFNNLTVF